MYERLIELYDKIDREITKVADYTELNAFMRRWCHPFFRNSRKFAGRFIPALELQGKMARRALEGARQWNQRNGETLSIPSWGMIQ